MPVKIKILIIFIVIKINFINLFKNKEAKIIINFLFVYKY